jgi:hypothetical protein
VSAAEESAIGARPFVTIFADKSGMRVNAARQMDLTELARVIRSAPKAPEKSALPLLKLARFGSKVTNKKSLRHDANILAVTGLAVDYDGEQIDMRLAAEMLSALDIAALFYTSANHEIVEPPHSHGGPRWRVIVPLARTLEGTQEELDQQHRHWVGVLNATLGGILSSESFALSQSYFFGPIEGRAEPEIIQLSGRCLDELENPPLPLFPVEKATNKGSENESNSKGGIGEDRSRDLLKRVSQDVRAGRADYEILTLHARHPHAMDQADGGRAIQRAIDKARAEIAQRKEPVPADGTKDRAPPAAGTPETFEAKRLDAISDAPRAAVVQRLIERDTVAALAGPPNAGKSAAAIDLALHVAAGETWFGLKVAQSPVLYGAVEAAGSVVMRSKIATTIKFPGQSLPFYLMAGTPMFGDEDRHAGDTLKTIETINAVSRIEGKPVGLFIADTLASCLGRGEENSGGMQLVAESAKAIAAATGAAVLLIHHPSKGGDSSGLRGHGSMAAACDTIIVVSADDAGIVRTMTLAKSRDFAVGLQLAYELSQVTLDQPDEFGDPRTTIIVKPVAVPVQRSKPKGKAQATLLADLERRHRTGETGWDLATVTKACRDLGVHRNTVPKAVTALRTGGFLRGSDAHLTLTNPPEADE